MKIPIKTTKKWKDLQSEGDLSKLMELSGKSLPVITTAMNKGKATLDVFNVIKAFYQEREKHLTV